MHLVIVSRKQVAKDVLAEMESFEEILVYAFSVVSKESGARAE
jgi:hypothetical protein